MSFATLNTENIISPFSSRQGYSLRAFPFYSRPPGVLSAWEDDTLELLSSVYASAYFQIAPKSGQRRKLDSLNHAGIIYKYQLFGGQNDKKINIAASRPFSDVKEILKCLAFTQLIVKLREITPVKITESINADYEIIIGSSIYSVFILRSSDNPLLFIPVINSLEKCFIVSETFHPEFKNINIPARIALDDDLLSNPRFYLPDGSLDDNKKAC